MTLPSLSLEVVGVKYPNADRSNRASLIAAQSIGNDIQLRPEPTNKRDPYAVAVFDSEGGQLGYLRAERAPHIGKLIRQGMEVRAVFQAASEHGAWIRVAFDGEEPVIPKRSMPVAPLTPQTTDEADVEFWPDPDWDEPA